VSYSTSDYDLALDLRRGLNASGLRPFVAKHDLAAQIGSSEWLTAVRRVLSRSRVLVALVTRSAQQSDWVADECRDFDALVQDRGQGILISLALA
jgi:hypothetical protein